MLSLITSLSLSHRQSDTSIVLDSSSLSVHFLNASSTSSFVPALVAMLGFLLNYSSHLSFTYSCPRHLISALLYGLQPSPPSRIPRKSYDWIVLQQPLQCCWLIFVSLTDKELAQIGKHSFLFTCQQVTSLHCNGKFDCHGSDVSKHIMKDIMQNSVNLQYSWDHSKFCKIHIIL